MPISSSSCWDSWLVRNSFQELNFYKSSLVDGILVNTLLFA
uniref:Uncharacterized protein n=1 Tax=Rhizophora mucronata TaxID=61149 RepID=A0A2P2QXU0_RHIMU